MNCPVCGQTLSPFRVEWHFACPNCQTALRAKIVAPVIWLNLALALLITAVELFTGSILLSLLATAVVGPVLYYFLFSRASLERVEHEPAGSKTS